MPTLNSILTECAHDLLDTEDVVEVDHVVACAYGRYRDVFENETKRLVWNAARDAVKHILRRLSEDDADSGQQGLPGIHLPSAIAVPQPDGSFGYVQAEKATWDILLAGRTVRVQNVDRAQAKLDLYDATLARLRRFMESDSGCTVADAVRRERGAA